MVNVKTVNGGIEISVKGDLHTLIADVSIIVYSVYESIKERNATTAEIFKRYFCEKSSEIFDIGEKEQKHSSTDVMDMFINRLDELSAILKAEKAKKEDK